MPRKKSEFEYTVTKFSAADLDRPVTVIVETNDSYQMVLDTASIENCMGEGTAWGDAERGGIVTTDHDSAWAWLQAEFDLELAGGNMAYDDDGKLITREAWIAKFETTTDMVLGTGIFMVTKLTGRYCDPDTLFEEIYANSPDGDE